MTEQTNVANEIAGGQTALKKVLDALMSASHDVFNQIKDNQGLSSASSKNTSGDAQIGLDVLADQRFRELLGQTGEVAYVISEEQSSLVKLPGAHYSVSLDPLDGSKSARVGIPSGSIFAVFENVQATADFVGKNVIASGFFVYGVRHELFVAHNGIACRFREQDQRGQWIRAELNRDLPTSNTISINASNFPVWPKWMQDFYTGLFSLDAGARWNMRWYASLVSDVKRLLIEGGAFAYPADVRPGYEHGQLRLVYEAIPMAYLAKSLGIGASDGEKDILSIDVNEPHQKTPLFLGSAEFLEQLQKRRKINV